jgi:hypothetical protein
MKKRNLLLLVFAGSALSGCASAPRPVLCEFRPAAALMTKGRPVPQISGTVGQQKLLTSYYRAIKYGRQEHRLRGALQGSVREHQERCSKLRKRYGS